MVGRPRRPRLARQGRAGFTGYPPTFPAPLNAVLWVLLLALFGGWFTLYVRDARRLRDDAPGAPIGLRVPAAEPGHPRDRLQMGELAVLVRATVLRRAGTRTWLALACLSALGVMVGGTARAMTTAVIGANIGGAAALLGCLVIGVPLLLAGVYLAPVSGATAPTED